VRGHHFRLERGNLLAHGGNLEVHRHHTAGCLHKWQLPLLLLLC
jgi:hypothetical protein